MGTLIERLEVQLPRETLEILRQETKRRGVSVGELAGEAIDLLLQQDREARLQAAQALSQVEAPVADWKAMKEEIEEARCIDPSVSRAPS
jgi:hypothetical protein